MRALRVSGSGAETPLETFARDHASMCRVADSGMTAEIRVWHAAHSYVSLGRFHRRPLDADALVRRVTGGKPYSIGPGVLCMTGVYPSLAWLGAGSARLEPEQALNRALRPLLAAVRDAGADAFYPGRDLITLGGRTLAVASFTVLPDGVVVTSTALAVGVGFGGTAAAIAAADRTGSVTFDAEALAGATTLEAALGRPAGIDWVGRVAEHAAGAHTCEADVCEPEPLPSLDVGAAFAALQAERGPLAAGTAVAYGIEMLGAVEAAAKLAGGRIAHLELAGDLIAPFATIEELAASMHGEPPTRAAAERAVLAVLTRPGRFLLGVRDLGSVIARLT